MTSSAKVCSVRRRPSTFSSTALSLATKAVVPPARNATTSACGTSRRTASGRAGGLRRAPRRTVPSRATVPPGATGPPCRGSTGTVSASCTPYPYGSVGTYVGVYGVCGAYGVYGVCDGSVGYDGRVGFDGYAEGARGCAGVSWGRVFTTTRSEVGAGPDRASAT